MVAVAGQVPDLRRRPAAGGRGQAGSLLAAPRDSPAEGRLLVLGASKPAIQTTELHALNLVDPDPGARPCAERALLAMVMRPSGASFVEVARSQVLAGSSPDTRRLSVRAPLERRMLLHPGDVVAVFLDPGSSRPLDCQAPAASGMALPLTITRSGAVLDTVTGQDVGSGSGGQFGGIVVQVGHLLFVSSLLGYHGNTGGAAVFRIDHQNPGDVPSFANNSSPIAWLPLQGNPEGIQAGPRLLGVAMLVVRLAGDALDDDYTGLPIAPDEEFSLALGVPAGPTNALKDGGFVMYRVNRRTAAISHQYTWSAKDKGVAWDTAPRLGIVMSTLPRTWRTGRGQRAAVSDILIVSSDLASGTVASEKTITNPGAMLLLKLEDDGTVGNASTSMIVLGDGTPGMPPTLADCAAVTCRTTNDHLGNGLMALPPGFDPSYPQHPIIVAGAWQDSLKDSNAGCIWLFTVNVTDAHFAAGPLANVILRAARLDFTSAPLADRNAMWLQRPHIGAYLRTYGDMDGDGYVDLWMGAIGAGTKYTPALPDAGACVIFHLAPNAVDDKVEIRGVSIIHAGSGGQLSGIVSAGDGAGADRPSYPFTDSHAVGDAIPDSAAVDDSFVDATTNGDGVANGFDDGFADTDTVRHGLPNSLRHGFADANTLHHGVPNSLRHGFADANALRHGHPNSLRHGFADANTLHHGHPNCLCHGFADANTLHHGHPNCLRHGDANTLHHGHPNCLRHGFADANTLRHGHPNSLRHGFADANTLHHGLPNSHGHSVPIPHPIGDGVGNSIGDGFADVNAIHHGLPNSLRHGFADANTLRHGLPNGLRHGFADANTLHHGHPNSLRHGFAHANTLRHGHPNGLRHGFADANTLRHGHPDGHGHSVPIPHPIGDGVGNSIGDGFEHSNAVSHGVPNGLRHGFADADAFRYGIGHPHSGTLRWATEGSVSESGVLTDEEASSGVLSCGVLRAQPPMRPSARACGRVTSVDVLLPLGVRAELEARNVAAGAWAAGNQSSAAQCNASSAVWWAGGTSLLPRTVQVFAATGEVLPGQLRQGLPTPAESPGAGAWGEGSWLLATVQLDGAAGKVVDVAPSPWGGGGADPGASQDGAASLTLATVSEADDAAAQYDAAEAGKCAGRPVALLGQPALQLRVRLTLDEALAGRALRFFAAAGNASDGSAGAAAPAAGMAVGPVSADVFISEGACAQLPLRVTAPTVGPTGVQVQEVAGMVALSPSSPFSSLRFALPTRPVQGETVVVGCLPDSGDVVADHSASVMDGAVWSAAAELQVRLQLLSASPTDRSVVVHCAFASTAMPAAEAVRSLLRSQKAMEVSSQSPAAAAAKRRTQAAAAAAAGVDALFAGLSAPTEGALYSGLGGVSVEARVVGTRVPLLAEVLVKQAGANGGSNQSRWQAASGSGATVLLPDAWEGACPSASELSQAGAAIPAAGGSELLSDLVGGLGAEVTSSGSSELLLVCAGAVGACFGPSPRVLVGSAEARVVSVAADGTSARVILPAQSDACAWQQDAAATSGVLGAWAGLPAGDAGECGWRGVTILPEGAGLAAEWRPRLPAEGRVLPLCPAAAKRLDLVPLGSLASLCLVGTERERVLSGGTAVSLLGATLSVELSSAAQLAGYSVSQKDAAISLVTGALASQALAVYFTEQCAGFAAPGPACAAGTSDIPCAHGSGDACQPCWSLCPGGDAAGGAVECARCPGGSRVWPGPGYWVSDESADSVARCDPPATSRCLGWNATLGACECGVGFTGVACSGCEQGYYPHSTRGCASCPAGTPLQLLLMPVALYGGLALSLVAGTLGLFGMLQCAAPAVDRREALRRSAIAQAKEGGATGKAARAAAGPIVEEMLAKSGGRVPMCACDRAAVARAAGRAAQLGLWSVLSIQALVQVSRTLEPGVPAVVAQAFSMLSVFELSPSVAVHPQCLTAAPLTVETAVMIAVLAASGMLGLAATAVCLMQRPSRSLEQKGCSSWASGPLPGLFSVVSLTYVLGTNTAVGVLNCVDAGLAGAPAGVTGLVMATNPFVPCGTGAHVRARVFAIAVVCVVTAGMPLASLVFLSRRASALVRAVVMQRLAEARPLTDDAGPDKASDALHSVGGTNVASLAERSCGRAAA
ncbi:hypothetical protein FNF29_07856 [Cafeteria roenbergensis]|uniref:Laminin EGF-like domain-containing protein n=1 Tax=Cafeteria roenbergensis TaxID=33653 RepID=A0A5A8C1W5_CAFRO|nr:hypothetical protein FNF29_07856 [Cafeteria roenbergensis]|eukprot:KAA0146735.1 hypothetical protein FNF29_07856 [Cafeteria roenbergensis]